MPDHSEWILIVDYGSAVAQSMAQELRRQNIYCEIHPYNVDLKQFSERKPQGIILSDSTKNIWAAGKPLIQKEILNMGVPVLAVGYALQQYLYSENPASIGKTVASQEQAAGMILRESDDLLKQIPSSVKVPVSGGGTINVQDDKWIVLAESESKTPLILKLREVPLYGIRLHCSKESNGICAKILNNFACSVCGVKEDWTPQKFIEYQIKSVREKVGGDHVLCALSGGVDSTVTATLLHKALGNKLHCVFVDTGLLRKNEFEDVLDLYLRELKLPVKGIRAADIFLNKLAGVTEPEAKRKIIGNTFIEIFEQQSRDTDSYKYLAQGTLYPDVIESVHFEGGGVAVKSHHNVGGLPEKMNLDLIEPVRELFKDEVRNVGRALGIPERFITRHPFPGPGLGVRVLGAVSKERLDILRDADKIFIDELRSNNLYDKVWQAFVVLLPVQSVGVSNSARTYEFSVALRAVLSTNGMAAKVAELPFDFLTSVSKRIIDEVAGINRVVYDISTKPPATIEWE